MTVPYTITRNASLAAGNTLRVAAQADILVDVRDPRALPDVLANPEIQRRALLLLGEGSNVLFTQDFAGAIVRVRNRGVQLLDETGDGVRVRAAAGENWHELVRWSLDQGLRGLENLSLIPGTVGAAPVQNIGAYGVELASGLVAVDAFDRERGETVRMSREQCQFSYRQSRFKQSPDRWVITAVELQLQREAELQLDYAGVRAELESMGVDHPTALDVSNAVCNLRRRKLPDPAEIGNVGSFFKNPVVTREQARTLQQQFPRLPLFEVAGGCKLSAAWLIDQCGWKGFREGDAGISEKHALVLVNYGKATGAELWTLAQRVRDSVQDRFAIVLEPEPRIIQQSAN